MTNAHGQTSAFNDLAAATARSVCERYRIDHQSVLLREMSGVKGGLGNAIPLPIPYRRRHVVRYHRCMRSADELALRGLFAHELIHVLHYSHASYRELLSFIFRYTVFAVTADTVWPIGSRWVSHLEHLTDLLAIERGEGPAISAWKRFKEAAMERGEISDSWAALYLTASEVDELSSNSALLRQRILGCVNTLRAQEALRPF